MGQRPQLDVSTLGRTVDGDGELLGVDEQHGHAVTRALGAGVVERAVRQNVVAVVRLEGHVGDACGAVAGDPQSATDDAVGAVEPGCADQRDAVVRAVGLVVQVTLQLEDPPVGDAQQLEGQDVLGRVLGVLSQERGGRDQVRQREVRTVEIGWCGPHEQLLADVRK